MLGFRRLCAASLRAVQSTASINGSALGARVGVVVVQELPPATAGGLEHDYTDPPPSRGSGTGWRG
jgi:hypothetical protein